MIERSFKVCTISPVNDLSIALGCSAFYPLDAIALQSSDPSTQITDQDFIDKTAINQAELISLTEATGAKTVTMFIDSCYSGQTRNGDALLVNARPVALKSKSTGYPSTFTVLTASAPDQISWSSDELGHGIFSYYLMKGMEGGADGNQDGKLTAGELHAYLLDKVNRQAAIQNKKQQPQLVGDPDQIVFSR